MNQPQQEMTLEVNPQDLMDAVTAQRDAAFNEIVRQAAIIRALQRKLSGEPTAPADAPAEPL